MQEQCIDIRASLTLLDKTDFQSHRNSKPRLLALHSGVDRLDDISVSLETFNL